MANLTRASARAVERHHMNASIVLAVLRLAVALAVLRAPGLVDRP